MSDLLASIKAFVAARVETDRLRYTESQRNSLDTADIVRAQCQGYVKAVCAAFPGVEAVSGFYGVAAGAADHRPGIEHWWCALPDGALYDPTVEQFERYYGIPPAGGVYTRFDPNYHHIYKGRCMACGTKHYSLLSQSYGNVCRDDPVCAAILEREYG